MQQLAEENKPARLIAYFITKGYKISLSSEDIILTVL